MVESSEDTFCLCGPPIPFFCDESDFESYEYFNGEKAILPDNVSGFKENHKIKHAQGWKELKRFAEVYYPTTEIISVNPVGLRGMFKDLYTITH